MSKNEIAISVQDVSKSFKLPHEKHGSIKSAFVNVFRGTRTYEKQQVLKDVSFEIKKGEFFGIVGRNGSGKSTLLKLLAGIYSPDKGHIQISGKLTPFIELGVGFNPELTGRENVFLNGALLGFDRRQMEAMYDKIVEFAELEKFMDQKLKNYSSGMQVRLAFSIAIRADTEILLLDEVLAVGDENFQRKCYEYFAHAKKNKLTVIFVSHDMSAVRDFCTKAILVEGGKIIAEGSGSKMASKYSELNAENLEKDPAKDEHQTDYRRWGNGDARIEKVWSSIGGNKKTSFRPNEKIEINIEIKTKKALKNPIVGMILQDAQERVVFATNTKETSTSVSDINSNAKINATFEIDNIFTDGTYYVSCAIANSDRTVTFSRVENIHKIVVSGWSMPHGLTHPEHSAAVKVS